MPAEPYRKHKKRSGAKKKERRRRRSQEDLSCRNSSLFFFGSGWGVSSSPPLPLFYLSPLPPSFLSWQPIREELVLVKLPRSYFSPFTKLVRPKGGWDLKGTHSQRKYIYSRERESPTVRIHTSQNWGANVIRLFLLSRIRQKNEGGMCV